MEGYAPPETSSIGPSTQPADALFAEQVAVEPVGAPPPVHCQRQAEPVSLYSANVPAVHPFEVFEAG